MIVLSELHTQQIALFGYIQLDGKMMYVKDKFNIDPCIAVPYVPGMVISHNGSVGYVLTEDQNKAKRV